MLWCTSLNRIESHRRWTDMNHLRWTVLCRQANASLLILECHTFIQLPCYPELHGHLTPSVFGILLKEIGAGIPTLAAAYAAFSIYCDVDHEIILA
jgi:hypothetical protein